MVKKLGFLIGTFIFFVTMIFAVLCSAGFSPYKKGSQFSSVVQCIDSYNRDNVAETLMPKSERTSVQDYFYCRAIGERKPSECDHLDGEFRKRCYKYYSLWYEFFLPLIRQKNVSSNILQAGVKAGYCPNMDTCQKIATTILNRDGSLCKTFSGDAVSSCNAMAKRDASLAINNANKNIILMINAVEKSDSSLCNMVEDEKFRTACFATFAKNAEPCKKCSGYELLSDYCAPWRKK